jgi:hypothetical protein
MKKIWMLITGIIFTMYGYGQATQQQVEKQVGDSLRKANAGKADVIIANNKNIYDSTTFNNNITDTASNKTVKTSARNKNCGNKTRHRNKEVHRRK